jgi:hypothetical protein
VSANFIEHNLCPLDTWYIPKPVIFFEDVVRSTRFNPLNAKLNPICHLLALLGAHRILQVSRIRVKRVT